MNSLTGQNTFANVTYLLLFNMTANLTATTPAASVDSNSTYDRAPPPLAVDAILVPAIWSLLVVIGALGNGLVIYVIVMHHERKVTYTYIVNLAITDFAFLVVCVPFTMTFYVLPQWIFGETMCKLVMYVIYVTVMSTCLTLTAMTVDRYAAICHPLRSIDIRTPKLAVVTSVGIWIISLLLSIPYGVYHVLKREDSQTYCVAAWPSAAVNKIQVLASVVITYVLPLSIIIVCYSAILMTFYRRSSNGRSNHNDVHQPLETHQQSRDIQLRNRKKLAKMVATVVALFAICWFPIHFFQIWFALAGEDFPRNMITYNFKIFAHTLSYANSCLNPFVYSFMGDGFKRAFRPSFPECFKVDRLALSNYGKTVVLSAAWHGH
ncbi:G-protein coupled receptor 54-like [Tubulanus polymorphus]|uniref:G-protein coupled receptor 54-like n=1 Tax=Tubulanus polymorphus TaxID=672921 RepID=UPI003DA4842E